MFKVTNDNLSFFLSRHLSSKRPIKPVKPIFHEAFKDNQWLGAEGHGFQFIALKNIIS
jgi:hypothetical protein